jgi:hypothetical protein
MRRLLILAIVGCASGGGSTSTGQPDRILLVDEQGRVYRTTNNSVNTVDQEIPGTREEVVRHLVGAYEELGVTVTAVDPQLGRVAAANFTSPSRLGGQLLPKYVNCGADQFGRPRAGTYELLLNTTSMVEPGAAGYMRVRTAMTATARQRGVSGDPITCETTGELEKRLNTMTVTRAASPAK